ncbi:MAG: UpxY family transcription antiterminator [Bacteroidales bacterium]|nr:UpxY family transcription antiterminator [Bacteroidales bacterium]
MAFETTYNWYALYTKSRAEKAVFDRLQEQQIETFLPLQKILRRWSDRKKWVEVPYINSYIFVKVSEKEYYNVLNIQGAVRYITFERKAAPIPEWQIEAMKKIVSSDQAFHFSNQHFKKGDQIKIQTGALQGYEGEIVHDAEGKKKVLIRIDHIGYSVVVEMDVLDVKKNRL